MFEESIFNLVDKKMVERSTLLVIYYDSLSNSLFLINYIFSVCEV